MHLALRLALGAALLIPLVTNAQRRCTRGVPCGNSCIAAGKTCHVGAPTATPTPAPPQTVAPDPLRSPSVTALQDAGATGRYQVVVLPPRANARLEWLVVDTQSGQMWRWTEEPTMYRVESIARDIIATGTRTIERRH
jgi:hypothetical protein